MYTANCSVKVKALAAIFLSAMILPGAKLGPGKYMKRAVDAVEIATVDLPQPPEIIVPFHSISIQVQNSAGSFPYTHQLGLSLEKELTGAFSVLAKGSDGMLSVAVLEYARPVTRTYSVTENRVVAATGGTVGLANLFGQPVPVTYWEAAGGLTLKSVLTNKQAESLDEGIVRVPFSIKREIAVNNVKEVEASSLPNDDSIASLLLLRGAEMVRRRYAVGAEPYQVKLAVDGELQPGNHLAMSEDWAGALRTWSGVSGLKLPGDRLYNMALANYELGFKTFTETQDTTQADSYISEADKLMAQAKSADPMEPYFKEVDGRMSSAKVQMEKEAKQAKALRIQREREAADHTDEAAARDGSATGGKSLANAPKVDTPAESEFRKYLQAQWKNRSTAPTPAELSAMQATGKLGWKLTQAESEYVVGSETTAWNEAQQKEALYTTNLKGFLLNGTLPADGRAQLRKLAANLGLTDTQVAAAESKVSFQEEGKSRRATTRAATHP